MRSLRSLVLTALVVTGMSVAATAKAANPLLVITDDSGTLTATLGDGTTVGTPDGSGAAIPPGLYDVAIGVVNATAVIQLSGPGVNVNYNENGSVSLVVRLAPSSTYVFDDPANLAATRRVFSTSAQLATAATGATTTVATGPPVHNVGVVGTDRQASTPVTGTLVARLTPGPELLRQGVPVARLPAGRYRIVVHDSGAGPGFALEPPGKRAVVLTQPSFVGTRSTTVVLVPGRWRCTAGGKRSSFLVVAR